MKIKISIFFILFLAITISCFAESKAFIKTNPIDLGNLAEGKLYKFSFPIQNIGDSDLIIQVVQSTCGCVQVLEPKKEAITPPVSKIEVKYSVDTTGLSGEMIKYLYVHTNDKTNPALKVIIKANIERKKETLLERFRLWGVGTIISAGLIDGINPCAFTVLVFFMSFLAFVGYNKQQMFILGSFFILAVFITYLLIGVGLFELFRKLEVFALLSKIIYFLTAILALVLGIFSFYDWWIYKKTKDPERITLKLPDIIKRQIHSVIKEKVDARRNVVLLKGAGFKLAIAALSSGFIVSILESVCTGQLYLPTIVYVLGIEHLRLRAVLFLFLYNLMFILPLIIIFLFALWGMTSESFAKLAKTHLAKIKIATSAVFLGLGLGLLFIIRR
ncbi:MAG: DUF1573 domain-containing protein [Candidatus Omnitrophota bacterium]|nr:DUF1573 domain-containing protein [Candidatus Omnitrophota bacterium]